MNYLNNIWPNLRNAPNEGLWKNGFEKHSSWFFPAQEDYFASTVWMMHQIPDLTQKLEHKGCILYFYII